MLDIPPALNKEFHALTRTLCRERGGYPGQFGSCSLTRNPVFIQPYVLRMTSRKTEAGAVLIRASIALRKLICNARITIVGIRTRLICAASGTAEGRIFSDALP